MDNSLILQLIKKDLEEIHTLISHFQENPSTLESGIDIARTKMDSLNKEFEMIKVNNKRFQSQIQHPPKTVEVEQEDPIIVTQPQVIEKEGKATLEQAPAVCNDDKSTHKNGNDAFTSPSKKKDADYPDILGNKLGSRAISDIRSAIGINDRMLFIRQLFNNSTTTYNRTIEHLNRQESYQAALEWLEKEYHWDQEDMLVQNFINITKRKFK